MLFNEIKAKIENKESLSIEVKKYLPFVNKTLFVNDMINSCITENEKKMKMIDFTQKQLCFDIYILRDYADLEFDADSLIDQYDYLKENGAIEYIISIIEHKDKEELIKMVDQSLEQEVKTSNSLEGILNNGIQDVISKIPESSKIDKWVKSLVKTIKDFKPEQYSKLNELLDFSKGKEKEGV